MRKWNELAKWNCMGLVEKSGPCNKILLVGFAAAVIAVDAEHLFWVLQNLIWGKKFFLTIATLYNKKKKKTSFITGLTTIIDTMNIVALMKPPIEFTAFVPNILRWGQRNQELSKKCTFSLCNEKVGREYLYTTYYIYSYVLYIYMCLYINSSLCITH